MIIKLGKLSIPEAKRPRLGANHPEFDPPTAYLEQKSGNTSAEDASKATTQPNNSNAAVNEATTYPNNATTADDFHWHYNGNNNVKASGKRGKLEPGEQTVLRKYYKCSEKNARGCKAKKDVTYLPSGTTIEYKNNHNHPLLKKPSALAEVKEKVMSQLEVNAKPSVILRQLVKDAPRPLSRKHIPTRQDLYNWQHQLNVADLPSGK